MGTVLFINACVRPQSRTMLLARRVLERLGGRTEEVVLAEQPLRPLDLQTLCRRDALLQDGDLGADMFRYARQFAAAESIVVAAPYWDMSFPAALKVYFENVMVTGVTFGYTPEGIPRGLCRAGQLVYVTTAGGPILGQNHGFAYVRALAENYFGIRDIRRFSAEGLDIVGADVDALLARALEEIDRGMELPAPEAK